MQEMIEKEGIVDLLISLGDRNLRCLVFPTPLAPSLSQKIANLQQVSRININSAGLQQFPCLKELPNLKAIMLVDNTISNIHESVFELRLLTELILARNHFKTLEVFLLCVRLEILNISHNQVSEIPYRIHPHALPRTLRELYLSLNGLTSLESFSRLELRSLEILHVSRNCLISARPFARMHCPNLKMIQASGNKLIDPPNWSLLLCKPSSTINIADVQGVESTAQTWYKLGIIRGPKIKFKVESIKII